MEYSYISLQNSNFFLLFDFKALRNKRFFHFHYFLTAILHRGLKVRSLLEHSCAILISFKIVVIFNTTSADIKTKSADNILKMTTILKEMRIAQLCSKS